MGAVAFVVIAIACIVSAAINCGEVSARGDNHNSSPVLAHASSAAAVRPASGTLWEHVAPGASVYSQRKYKFNIRRVGNEYRAYILESPSYRGRATDLHSTHRHYDGWRYYVCWSNPVTSYDDMVNVATQWANCTQQYIEHGTRF